MAPLGWKWAGFVWAYALAWFLINDRLKLLAYRFLDHAKADVPKHEAKADQSKPDAKADAPNRMLRPMHRNQTPSDQPKPEVKAETKPDAAPDQPKPDAKLTHANRTPRSMHQSGSESRGKAGTPRPTSRKPDAKADAPETDATADAAKPEAKADQPKPEVKAGPNRTLKAERPETGRQGRCTEAGSES